VASNYAPILVGMFIFPIIFFGLFAAKKRRVTAKEWEMSHYDSSTALQWVSLWEFLRDSLLRLLFYPAYRQPRPTSSHDNVVHPGIKTQFSFVRLGGHPLHLRPISGRRKPHNRQPKNLLGVAQTGLTKDCIAT
jgi:hypothetical protein